MANPTTIVGYTAVLLDTTAAAQTLALRPDRNYAIRHLGIDNTNTTDSNLVKIAVNQTDGTGPADPVHRAHADDRIKSLAYKRQVFPVGQYQVKTVFKE